MNCEQTQQRLDDYLDGDLNLREEAELHAHLDQCKTCRVRVRQAEEVLTGLKVVKVPEMTPGFAHQAVRQAANQIKPRSHRTAFVAGFSSALVAGLALVFVIAGLLPDHSDISTEMLPQVAISVETPQTVNLAFDLANAIQNATLSIDLPEHIEVVGFPGLRRLSWQTNLTRGRNVLPLPLKGVAQTNGELVATVEHDGKTKSIRINVRVDEQLTPKADLATLKLV